MDNKKIEYIIPIGTPYKGYRKQDNKEYPYTLHEDSHARRCARYVESDILHPQGKEYEDRIFVRMPPEALPIVMLSFKKIYVVKYDGENFEYMDFPDKESK